MTNSWPTFLIKGIVIGFSIAAPVGPIGVLCIRRSLADGRKVGFVTGLRAATADAIYGFVAAFGVTAVSSFLVGQRKWLGLLGGAFLCYLGIRTNLSKPASEAAKTRANGLAAAYLSTFLLTLSNPMTILSFVAVFTGFGLATSTNYLSAWVMVAGVFAGSALWWLLLSFGVALFRSRLGDRWMRVVNQLSGAIMLAFGLYAIASGLFR